jgi:hypothetical protein
LTIVGVQRWPDAGPRKVRKRFMDTVEAGGLSVAKALYDFMNDEACPKRGSRSTPKSVATKAAAASRAARGNPDHIA